MFFFPELDDFLQELDEDVEGMQSTILFLQQELKTTRDRIQILEKENFELKTGVPSSQDEPASPMIKQEQAMRGDEIDSDGASTIINGNIFSNTVPQMPADQSFISSTSQPQPMLMQTPTMAPLETIDENNSLRNNSSSYYNGTEDAALNELILEGNGGGAIGAKLRTVASRKRNYECDAPSMDSVQTAPLAMVSSPRTLPPKKSKLRVATTPVRRTSIQSIEENEILINTGVNTIVDNAVDGMANEETSACGAVDPLANDATVNVMEQSVSGGAGAQRILTRRRSVRLNGASNGGGGGDSNH